MQKGDFVIFFKSGEIVALNIFNLKKYLQVTKTQTLDYTIVNIIEREINTKLNIYPFFIVGKINEVQIHPKTNKLLVTKVDIGNQVIQIVTNKINLKKDTKVVVALENSVLPNGKLISISSIMGLKSFGMFCSYKTLNINNNEEIISPKMNLGSTYEF